MSKLIKSVLTAAALCVSFGAPARAAVNPLAEQIKRDIIFETRVKTPNELDEAVVPYLQCVMAKSGMKWVDQEKDTPPSSSAIATDCTDLRNKAESESDSKLKSMGVDNTADRRAIIFNTLLVIDLAAQGNAAWMKEAK